MEMQDNVYERALAKAKSDLAALSVEFDKIAKKKAQLEAFIANAEPLLAMPQVPVSIAYKPLAPQEKVIPTPIWKSILNSINGKGASFTVHDAVAALDRIGKAPESPNRVQIVRNVLLTKKDNFEQIGPGRFRIKPRDQEEKEVASEKGTS
jgi:hypothetical protein